MSSWHHIMSSWQWANNGIINTNNSNSSSRRCVNSWSDLTCLVLLVRCWLYSGNKSRPVHPPRDDLGFYGNGAEAEPDQGGNWSNEQCKSPGDDVMIDWCAWWMMVMKCLSSSECELLIYTASKKIHNEAREREAQLFFFLVFQVQKGVFIEGHTSV